MSGLRQQSLNPPPDNVRLASKITQSSPWQCPACIDIHLILTMTMSGLLQQSLNPHPDNVGVSSTITQSSPWQCRVHVDKFLFVSPKLVWLFCRREAGQAWEEIQPPCEDDKNCKGHVIVIVILMVIFNLSWSFSLSCDGGRWSFKAVWKVCLHIWVWNGVTGYFREGLEIQRTLS